MAHDRRIWIWPVDVAVAKSNAYGWALTAALSYALGTLLLLAAPWGGQLAVVGSTLVAVGIGISAMVLGKVIAVRSRSMDADKQSFPG